LKAIYINSGINWGDPASTFRSVVDSGYNLVVLSFLVSNVMFDAATAWNQMSASAQQSTITYAHSKGARIIVSAGGATDNPYASMSGTAYGTFAANWANARYLDGVDFDLENFNYGFTAGSMSAAQTIQWVADATNAARSILGNSKVITHAPQPPYFAPGWSSAYSQIYKKAPSINFLLVQYYNNGPATTYESIFTNNDGTTVVSIKNAGVPLNKIVVGKPVNSGDAGSQYLPASSIRSIFNSAASLGWNAGVMGWQWHDSTTNGNWIRTIYP
jgi:chitinase